LIFFFTFVVWLVALVERVVDALFENLVWILWLMWTLWSWFRVRETKPPEECSEVIRAVGNTEFLLE
jgi:hypothetical protein